MATMILLGLYAVSAAQQSARTQGTIQPGLIRSRRRAALGVRSHLSSTHACDTFRTIKARRACHRTNGSSPVRTLDEHVGLEPRDTPQRPRAEHVELVQHGTAMSAGSWHLGREGLPCAASTQNLTAQNLTTQHHAAPGATLRDSRSAFEQWARPLLSPLPAELVNAQCVFMTGGHRAFWPGIRCVLRQLRAVHTSYPIAVAAPAVDVASLRAAIAEEKLNAYVVAWQRFPCTYPKAGGVAEASWKDSSLSEEAFTSKVPAAGRHSGSVLDKLNVLGAWPLRRVVWLDADLFVARNIDELCALPATTQFASVPYAPDGRPRCWSEPGPVDSQVSRRRTPQPSRGHQSGGQRGGAHGTHQGASDPLLCERCRSPRAQCGPRLAPLHVNASGPPCAYEFVTGVFVVTPLPPGKFVRQIIEPVCAGRVPSRDGGDQGAIASLIYGHRLFGAAEGGVARLSVRYQASVRMHTAQRALWDAWDPAVWHFGGWYKPWLLPPRRTFLRRRAMFNTTLAGVWRASCPGLLTTSDGSTVASTL